MSYENKLIREMTDETPPNHDDACPVCDKIDCVCPPEPEHQMTLTVHDLSACPPEPVTTLDHPLKHYFPVEREVDYNRSQFGEPGR
jgi:hypothetical protein